MTQRPGKMIRAERPNAGTITVARLIEFADKAAELLEAEDNDDAAFYFEQIAEHLRRNPHKGLDESVGRILGL